MKNAFTYFTLCLVASFSFFNASAQTCNVVAGKISTTSATTTCSGDGIADNINFIVTGNVGANSRVLFLDANGKILNIVNATSFNFEGAQGGFFGVRQISYENGLQGLTVGASINNLKGCYKLSTTGFGVTVFYTDPGTISLPGGATSVSYCVSDGKADNPQLTFTNSMSFGFLFVVTDLNDVITSTHFNAPNFEGTGAGTVRLRVIGSCLEAFEVPIGTSINALPANMKASNAITVTKTIGCTPPVICAPEVKSCPGAVLICKKNVSTCVKSNKVNGELKNGATLGGCIRCTGGVARTGDETIETPGDLTSTADDELIIYPNPNNGFFYIANSLKANNTVVVTNTLGQIIWKQHLVNDTEENSTLSLQGLSLYPGIYYIGVVGETGSRFKPFVIQ